MTQRLLSGLLTGGVWLLWWSAAASAEEAWVRLDGCRIIEHPSNDGDSFRVRHDGKEYLFRLCYVDAPETETFAKLRRRIREQLQYFGVDEAQLYEVADAATDVAMRAMRGEFTVYTQWKDARGASKLQRFFAVVKTPGGDLAEILVREGLARVYGYMPDHPNGTSGRDYMAKLRRIQEESFRSRRGAWAETSRSEAPGPPWTWEQESERPVRAESAPGRRAAPSQPVEIPAF